jgi:hypothetical protein
MSELLTLWTDQIETQEPNENKKRLLQEFGEHCHQNYNILYDLLDALKGEKDYESKEHNLAILFSDAIYVTYNLQVAAFSSEELKDYFITMMSLFTPILPLGSVIELEHPTEEEKTFPVVISHRFLDIRDQNLYIPYGCTPYPEGMQGQEGLIYVTNKSVKNILHHGHTDEKEKAFILLMKQQIILEEKKHSLEFANQTQMKHFQEMIEGEFM